MGITSAHSSRTVCRSEWRIPQKRISIWTSVSVTARRLIVSDASGDAALAADQALASYNGGLPLLMAWIRSGCGIRWDMDTHRAAEAHFTRPATIEGAFAPLNELCHRECPLAKPPMTCVDAVLTATTVTIATGGPFVNGVFTITRPSWRGDG